MMLNFSFVLMLFSDIVGQQEVKARLIKTVVDQRIPHAQLIKGPEGVGKLSLAIAYAQYICCENKNAQDSCGLCSSCVKYQKLAHPDLHFVFPVIKPAGKSSVVCDDFIGDFRTALLESSYLTLNDWYAVISDDAKQGMIYANESEEIIRKLSLKTYESEYKIMIVWLPEKMNVSCANKLLKILEEPPEKTLFLMVSNAPEEILNTILSRSQHIQVSRLNPIDIETAIKSKVDFEGDDQMLSYIARVANGSYSSALNLLKETDDNRINFDRFVTIMRLAWQVGNRKDHASLKTLKKWSEDMALSSVGRERQKNFLVYAQRMVRENYILNLKTSALNNLTLVESDFSHKFARFIHERNVEDIIFELALAERHIEQNVNAKMVFFDLVLKLIMLLKR